MDNTIYKYCTGCGLCKSLGKGTLVSDKKGFLHPIEGDESFLKKICPSYGVQNELMDHSEIWGRFIDVYYGWSQDNIIREASSSGGIITSLCWYLLNEGLVDGIIHTCADSQCPTKTKTCISSSYAELLSRCGSRYCISSPLDIVSKLKRENKYAFVGKPCDVDVLRNYMKIEPSLQANIPYLLSFFCMGIPSNDAQKRLLEFLGCEEHDCVSLRYRGDGWPGLTKAINKNGKEFVTDYDSSWGKILGRDLMQACRFCINGIGETADVSAGDAWYIGADNRPLFNESQGRNVVFARTKKGNELLKDALRKKYINLEEYKSFRTELPLSQYAQHERRGTLKARICALMLLNKPHPHYSKKLLNGYKKYVSKKTRLRYLKGTLERTIKEKD